MVIPLVVYGMSALTKLQSWTNPLWLVFIVLPMVVLIAKDPGSVHNFMTYQGRGPGHA